MYSEYPNVLHTHTILKDPRGYTLAYSTRSLGVGSHFARNKVNISMTEGKILVSTGNDPITPAL